MKLKYVMFCLLLATLATACRVKEGIVVDKMIEPEQSSIVMIPQYVNQNNYSSQMQVPYKFVDQEDYILVVRDNRKNSKQYTVYVKPECYHYIDVGQPWERGSCSSFNDTNNYQFLVD